MTDFKGRDPILVGKEKLGVVQELRDRNAWPKVPAEVVEGEKPKRGRPSAA